MLVATSASDAAQNVADSLNRGSITGWDLVAALIVVVLAIPAGRLAASATKRALKHYSLAPDDAAVDLSVVAKWLVCLLAVALAASILGVDIGFLSVLFAFALVIGALALKPMIENSASGVLLITRPAFSVGDQIQTKEFRGVVEEIGSRSTRLRQSDGIIVHVSNNQVLGNPIVVYSESDSRKGTLDITVPAATDLDGLTSKLMNAISSVDDVVEDPAPAVQASALSDNAITLDISYWFPSTHETGSTVADGVIRATTATVNDAGIALAVPIAEVAEESATAKDAAGSSPAGDDGNDQATDTGADS